MGTSPRGSTWARLPIPASGLGPRCECDMDTHYQPGDFKCGCKPCEVMGGNCSHGPCEKCPETPGSDCSRCDNPPKGGSSFTPPCDSHCMAQRPGVYDKVKIPSNLKPGRYVLGFRCVATLFFAAAPEAPLNSIRLNSRYDCDATAQGELSQRPTVAHWLALTLSSTYSKRITYVQF